MQKTTAQSQQESKKKARARLVLFWKPCYKNKRTCAHLMSLAQDNGIFIKSHHQQHVICIQTSKRTLFEQLFHLDYVSLVRTANSSRLLYLAVSWFLVRCLGEVVSWWLVGWWQNSLVARWPNNMSRDRDNKAHTHMIHIYLPFTRKSKGWKWKDVKIVTAEISLINSVPVCIKCL